MQIEFVKFVPKLGPCPVIPDRVGNKIGINGLPPWVRRLVYIVFDYFPVRPDFRPHLTDNNAVVREEINSLNQDIQD